MEITKTEIYSNKLKRDYTVAVAADLHNREYDDVIDAIREIKPDFILIPGDLTDNLNHAYSLSDSSAGFAFLHDVAKTARTYYSVGNHERKVSVKCMEAIKKSGAVLLDNATVREGEIVFGGLSSGLFESRYGATPPPNLVYLYEYAKEDGFKLLLSHHPEYYPDYIRDLDIDLTVSGHAHGGQWRIFGRGVYAPGQGLFPKYTSGLYENRLYVSRGLTNTGFPIPRFFNKTELAVLYLKKK